MVAEAVGKLTVMDIVNGLPGGIFAPEVTRAQLSNAGTSYGIQKIDSISFDDI